MPPSQYELTYFNGKGRAEAIRVCLFLAGIDFVDTRIAGTDWPTLKPSTPLGSLPVLKMDGVEHVQSTALLRYAGKLAGWYPAEDPVAALVVDEAVDSLNELMSKAPQVRGGDEAEKKRAREEFQATVMTTYAKFLESQIQRNGGVGFIKQPSIADLVLLGIVEGVQVGQWDYIDPKFFDAYPGIKETVEVTSKNEKVLAYYKSKE